MHCIKCQVDNMEGSKFCAACGAKLPPFHVASPEGYSAQPTTNPAAAAPIDANLEALGVFKVVKYIENVLEPLPNIPETWKAYLVKSLPMVALLSGIIAAMTSVSVASFLFSKSPQLAFYKDAYFSYGGTYSLGTTASLVSNVVSMWFYFTAYSPLSTRKLKGWLKLFWVACIQAGSSVISFRVQGVLGVLVSIYFLFQIKSQYSK
jgi:hypothetical protein